MKPLCMSLLVGMESGAAAMENSMEGPQKIKNKIAICPSNATSGYMYKRIESRILKRDLYVHVHSSITHKGQEVEATHVSIDE